MRTKSSIDIKQLEDIAVLKNDVRTVKDEQRDIKRALEGFIKTADNKYATKSELKDIKNQVSSNTNRIWQLSKEVAQWGTLIALISKSLGLW